MEPSSSDNNNNCVQLYLKYKKEFDKVILNVTNGSINPGKYCGDIKYNNLNTPGSNFITACQEIGRYLIEIKDKYYSDRFKRCKYLKYRINSDNNYKDHRWFDAYKEVSSIKENICAQELKVIDSNVLAKLTELYNLYENFNNFNIEKDQITMNCESARKCYEFYNKHYKDCDESNNDDFCEELKNFKEVYEDTMSNVTSCPDVPQQLPPKKRDFVILSSLTTAVVLLASFTLFFLYKFTPIKSFLRNRLQKKKISELREVEEKTIESIKNTYNEANINYEGSYHNIAYQPQ
ncbi:PIR protein [Plasmodium malariae]|uniref:PIR protein n=1 Tax=Plasmodium malariae TaxID=5858 RepID=A0A1D3JH22_PLAMA|nr:PIR protein [Plasmodium malariae]SBT85584.1 PIR protein [Plasmodium malariae]